MAGPCRCPSIPMAAQLALPGLHVTRYSCSCPGIPMAAQVGFPSLQVTRYSCSCPGVPMAAQEVPDNPTAPKLPRWRSGPTGRNKCMFGLDSSRVISRAAPTTASPLTGAAYRTRRANIFQRFTNLDFVMFAWSFYFYMGHSATNLCN